MFALDVWGREGTPPQRLDTAVAESAVRNHLPKLVASDMDRQALWQVSEAGRTPSFTQIRWRNRGAREMQRKLDSQRHMKRILSTNSAGRVVAVASAVSLCAGISTSAQDALQSAVQGDRSYRDRSSTEFILDRDAIRTGPLTYAIGVGYNLEWNDNVYSEASNGDQDFIHSPQGSVRATWQATRDSVISLGVGVGYQKYTKHSDLDRTFFTPDSDIAWDIPVKDWVFTLYDRFSYSQDLLNQGALTEPATSRTGEFPRLENTIGLRARWMPSQYVLEAGYGHHILYSSSGDYAYLNRATEQVFARAGYRFAEATQAGLEISGGLTSYDTGLRGDNQNFSVGPYAQWQLTEATYLALHGGYVLYHYNADNFDSAHNLSSWYISAEARNRLTDVISHGLTVSREVQQGANLDQRPGVGGNRNTDAVELLGARYSISWAFHEQGALGANVMYEHGTEPQVGVEQVFERYGFGMSASWRFTRHLSTGLGYRFTKRSSDTAPGQGDYQVNSVTLSANYQF